MIPIISFSIYTIGVSYIIVNTFNFIFTLIKLMAVICYINMCVLFIQLQQDFES